MKETIIFFSILEMFLNNFIQELQLVPTPSHIRLCLDLSKIASRFDNSMFLSKRLASVKFDWLFVFND
jgi:hypothetical protein